MLTGRMVVAPSANMKQCLYISEKTKEKLLGSKFPDTADKANFFYLGSQAQRTKNQ